jgi:hypothetical protein
MRRRRAIAAVAAVAVFLGLGTWLVTADRDEGAPQPPTRAYAATSDRDGHAYAAVERLQGGRWRAAVAREENGELDGAFGDDVPLENPRGIAVDSGGRVLVAGDRLTDGRRRLAVARFDHSGRLDRSFGRGGVATVAAGSGDAVAGGVVWSSRAGTVVVGDARDGDRHALAVATFPPAGGRARMLLVPDASAAGAALDRTDNAIVAGTDTRDGSAVLVRPADGAAPPVIRTRTRLTSASWRAVAVLPDGRLVVVGSGRDVDARSVIATQTFAPNGIPLAATTVRAGDGDAFGAAVAADRGGGVIVGATGIRGDAPQAFVVHLGHGGAAEPRGPGRVVGVLPGGAVLVDRWDGRVQRGALLR